MDQVTDIEINYLYCEHLKESDFPEGNPINNLVYEVNKNNMKKFRQKYDISQKLNFFDKGQNKEKALKIWPEDDL